MKAGEALQSLGAFHTTGMQLLHSCSSRTISYFLLKKGKSNMTEHRK
jgi:hypothetical protein